MKKKDQQRNRRHMEEPSGNFRYEKYNNWNLKKSEQMGSTAEWRGLWKESANLKIE